MAVLRIATTNIEVSRGVRVPCHFLDVVHKGAVDNVASSRSYDAMLQYKYRMLVQGCVEMDGTWRHPEGCGWDGK